MDVAEFHCHCHLSVFKSDNRHEELHGHRQITQHGLCFKVVGQL